MKKILMAIVVGCLSVAAQADVLVRSAQLSGDEIKVVVSYGGGCEDHKFEMEITSCMESYPVQCPVTVKDVSETPDFCEAYITEELTFSLEEEGLNESYFNGAALYFNWRSDNAITIRLPFVQ